MYNIRDDNTSPQDAAVAARTVELSDELDSPVDATAVIHVKREESVSVRGTNRAMDTVVATVQQQTQILTEMHTSQWSMEAYR